MEQNPNQSPVQRKRRVVGAWTLILVVLTIVLLGYPLIQGQPGPKEFALAEKISAMGGTATIRFGVILMVNFAGSGVTDDDLAALEEATDVKYLDLSNTRITDAGLGHLKDLAKLRELDISRTKVTDHGLAMISQTFCKLQRLMLDETEVGDGGLPCLMQLSDLRAIHVAGTKVTPAGVRNFNDAMRAKYGWPDVAFNRQRKS